MVLDAGGLENKFENRIEEDNVTTCKPWACLQLDVVQAHFELTVIFFYYFPFLFPSLLI